MRQLLRVRVFVCAAGLTVMAGCGSSSPAPTGPSSSIPLTPAAPPGVLIGAGDIAQCGTLGASLTAAVLDVFAGTVFAAGDIAYNSGTAAEFANCYDPHWGRHKARTRPVPGNHEYQSPGAGPYYDYFGSNAGTDRTGYYSYTVGPWLVLALNSEVDHSDSSAQVGWIRNQLSGFPGRCVAAIWHRPLFSSGPHQGDVDIRPLWRALYDANVDLVICRAGAGRPRRSDQGHAAVHGGHRRRRLDQRHGGAVKQRSAGRRLGRDRIHAQLGRLCLALPSGRGIHVQRLRVRGVPLGPADRQAAVTNIVRADDTICGLA